MPDTTPVVTAPTIASPTTTDAPTTTTEALTTTSDVQEQPQMHAPTTSTDVPTTTDSPRSTTDALTTSLTTGNQCFNYRMLLNTMDTSLSDTNLNTCLTIPRNVKSVTNVVKMELLPECVGKVQNDKVSYGSLLME